MYMKLFETILVGISGLAWTIVYIELIRQGNKDKACGMPLFALTLNLAWEWIYGIDGLFISKSFIPAQSIANIAWAIFDIFVMMTWIKYGKQYFPQSAKQYFIPATILAVVFGFAMQFAFYFNCETVEIASIYSAFLQNTAMSVMFIVMLFTRENTKAQTLRIAICKWLGTLTPTIYGQINGNSVAGFILITGTVCSVFDIIYICLLEKKIKSRDKDCANKFV